MDGTLGVWGLQQLCEDLLSLLGLRTLSRDRPPSIRSLSHTMPQLTFCKVADCEADWMLALKLDSYKSEQHNGNSSNLSMAYTV